jgi:hypothetical protein
LQALDTNHDGTLNIDGMQRLMSEIGIPIAKMEIYLIFKYIAMLEQKENRNITVDKSTRVHYQTFMNEIDKIKGKSKKFSRPLDSLKGEKK